MTHKVLPVFEHADWNEFSGGGAWVTTPLRAYSDPRFPFDIRVGDLVIAIENEEMTGVLGRVTDLYDMKDDNGTPVYVRIELLNWKLEN